MAHVSTILFNTIGIAAEYGETNIPGTCGVSREGPLRGAGQTTHGREKQASVHKGLRLSCLLPTGAL